VCGGGGGQLPGSLRRSLGELGTCVGSVDVCDVEALRALFHEHADANTTVWNLAAPLVRAQFSHTARSP
jgi:hypothetical protein